MTCSPLVMGDISKSKAKVSKCRVGKRTYNGATGAMKTQEARVCLTSQGLGVPGGGILSRKAVF